MPNAPLPLVDSFGRRHDNLRVSVTDRCNIRCVYCMPETVRFLPRQDLLSFDEIARFVRAVVPLGINKVRLTGGEPLLRAGLPDLIHRLSRIEGLDDLSLTTNGLLLEPLARALWDAGLRRLNVSLDTLDPRKFEELTRRPGLERVVAGLLAAREVGFSPLKVNALAMRGITEGDIVPLARFCREHGFELRFIEYMPLDAADQWERGKVLVATVILDALQDEFGPLAPAAGQDPRAPAVDYEYADGMGRVGVIASVTRPFCASCNRLRLTAEGRLRNCLFALEETDVRGLLRSGAGAGELERIVRESVAAKWEGHEINSSRFIKPDRLMYSIGG